MIIFLINYNLIRSNSTALQADSNNKQRCGLGRDVSVPRRTNVSPWSRLKTKNLQGLGLGPMRLGPLHHVETFYAGARREYCGCDTKQHDICGLDIFVYSVFTLSFTYLS